MSKQTAERIMATRQRLSASLFANKAACVANGDFDGLRALMVKTDDIMSGREDISDAVAAMNDDEVLAALGA